MNWRSVQVPSECHAVVDLSKPLGVALGPDATVVGITPAPPGARRHRQACGPGLDGGGGSGAQGGLTVGCRLVAVGDASVGSPEEVDAALSRWRYEDEPTAPITYQLPLPGRTERGLLAVMAPGQESRVRVDASEGRFHPSRWPHPETAGAVPGRDFSNLEERLPPLLGIRGPGTLLDKKWDLKSATAAFGLGLEP